MSLIKPLVCEKAVQPVLILRSRCRRQVSTLPLLPNPLDTAWRDQLRPMTGVNSLRFCCAAAVLNSSSRSSTLSEYGSKARPAGTSLILAVAVADGTYIEQVTIRAIAFGIGESFQLTVS
ncbi:MAG: hypothetical protein CLLPBCKN_008600 [Chroococcidiopsis cubana SAG 39.79]|nr:hypothetical protein [Chroococcidiopsis cubana SAG 39.79]